MYVRVYVLAEIIYSNKHTHAHKYIFVAYKLSYTHIHTFFMNKQNLSARSPLTYVSVCKSEGCINKASI